MPDKAALAGEIDDLERLFSVIAMTARDQGRDRRQELVDLRRRLAQQLGAVGALLDKVFAGSPDLAAAREKFSRMRSMAAMHQANWPAFKLTGPRPLEYHASAGPMRDANRDFIAWVRAALDRA